MNYLSLNASIISDERHAWFHFNGVCQAAKSAKQAKITNWDSNVQHSGYEANTFSTWPAVTFWEWYI